MARHGQNQKKAKDSEYHSNFCSIQCNQQTLIFSGDFPPILDVLVVSSACLFLPNAKG